MDSPAVNATSTFPVPGGAVKLISVPSPFTAKLVFGITTSPKEIAVTALRFVPVMTILPPPDCAPLEGDMLETVGGGDVTTKTPATNSIVEL